MQLAAAPNAALLDQAKFRLELELRQRTRIRDGFRFEAVPRRLVLEIDAQVQESTQVQAQRALRIDDPQVREIHRWRRAVVEAVLDPRAMREEPVGGEPLDAGE